MTVAANDEQLLATLDAQIVAHEQGAARARKDRRAVWLRLYEADYSYARLQGLSGVSRSVMHTELRRARAERGTV